MATAVDNVAGLVWGCAELVSGLEYVALMSVTTGFIVTIWEGQNPRLPGDGFSERAAG